MKLYYLSLDCKATSPYWKTLFRHLVEELIDFPEKDKTRYYLHLSRNIYEDILESLFCRDNTNIDILAVVIKTQVARGTRVFLKNELEPCFQYFPLFRKILDMIYDECGNLQSQRSGLIVLEELVNLNMLRWVIKEAEVCLHVTSCTDSSIPCFLSTLISFLSDCSPDTFSSCSSVLYKPFNNLFLEDHVKHNSLASQELYDPELKPFCPGVAPEWVGTLNRLLLRKLRHFDSRVRDMAVDFLGKLAIGIVEQEVVKEVMRMSYTDEDYYVKSSCFKVLEGMNYWFRYWSGLTVLCDICNTSCECKHNITLVEEVESVLGDMIEAVEHEDSMVAIAFFSFLTNQSDVMLKHLLERDMPLLKTENGANVSISMKDPKKARKVPLEESDLDNIIHAVCESSDCSDVKIIRRYDDKMTSSNGNVTSSNGNVTSHTFSDLLRLLVTDRCDIERMKGSIELVTKILNKLADKTPFLEYLRTNYFSMVETYNGPFLWESVKELNSALNGCHVFSEMKKLDKPDLETVLGLLRSTPDSTIVMDCF